jgi:HK97 family phage prohead protease
MNRKEAGATKVRAFELDIKSVTDQGTFSGYASLWNVVDTYRERVARGAFAESLAAVAAKGRKLPILWQHRTAEPIGVWDVLREDEKGLYSEGSLWLDDAPQARLAWRGMKAGAITGESIGYRVQEDSFDQATRVRTLKRLDLREVSIVTDPALEEARVDTIKQKLAAGELISEREFGRLLRDRGFSRSDADAIADVGFKAWAAGAGQPQQATNRAGMSELAKQLGGFSLPSI